MESAGSSNSKYLSSVRRDKQLGHIDLVVESFVGLRNTLPDCIEEMEGINTACIIEIETNFQMLL